MATINQDHVTAGVGALTISDATTTVLQHFQGVDATTASSEAALLIAAAAVLYRIGISAAAFWKSRQAAKPAVAAPAA